MATREEQIEKLKEVLRTRARQIFMVLMGLLLVARVYMFWAESNTQPAERAKPQEVSNLITAIRPDTMTAVRAIISPWPDLTTSSFAVLARIDMFDVKAVSNAEPLILRTNQIVAQGQVALDQGNTTEALRLVGEAQTLIPGSSTARLLDKKIKDKAAAVATPAAAGAPPSN